MTLRLGNVEHAFVEAEHVVETTFRLGTAILWIKSAVTPDGRITARHCTVSWGDTTDAVGRRVASPMAVGPYDIDNLQIDVAPMADDAFPGLVWALEGHTDRLARVLGIDPFDLRRRNIARDAAIAPVLDALERRMRWRGPVDRGTRAIRRGRGIAAGVQLGGAAIAATGVEVTVDTTTGRTRVIRLVTVADLGGRFEEVAAEPLDLDPGRLASASLAGEAIAELGACPSFAVAPAISNAIDDAVGVRLTAPPLTADAVQRGLRAAIGVPLSATAT
jgi:CO/xanthine dehydrogenase Mo-binding subunit